MSRRWSRSLAGKARARAALYRWPEAADRLSALFRDVLAEEAR